MRDADSVLRALNSCTDFTRARCEDLIEEDVEDQEQAGFPLSGGLRVEGLGSLNGRFSLRFRVYYYYYYYY